MPMRIHLKVRLRLTWKFMLRLLVPSLSPRTRLGSASPRLVHATATAPLSWHQHNAKQGQHNGIAFLPRLQLSVWFAACLPTTHSLARVGERTPSRACLLVLSQPRTSAACLCNTPFTIQFGSSIHRRWLCFFVWLLVALIVFCLTQAFDEWSPISDKVFVFCW